MNLHIHLLRTLPLALLAAGAAHAADTGTQSWTTRYAVAELPTLGGDVAAGNSIDDLGLISGFASLEGDEAWHATAWLYGLRFDLGTLGGTNSNVPWPVKNNVGLIAGIAQTGEPDPLGAQWSCRSFFPPPQHVGSTCLGFAWEHGEMRALPTLGGHNGFATGANDRREIAGWTENDVLDPACVAPFQYLQFRPVLWGPGRNQLRELPLPAGDSSGAATALNNRGQVVGISGICDRAVGRFTAAHAVLWERGRVIDIGNLGGVAWNTPMAINERGEVVGFSNVSAADGGAFHAHAFHWSRGGGLRDLGTLPGDTHSQALGMNNLGDAVGVSCDADFTLCRGVLWRNGAIIDLGTRLMPGYDGQIVGALDINDFGRITGQAFEPDSGRTLAFRAVPILFPFGVEEANASAVAASRAAPLALPPAVRKGWMDRFGIEEDDLRR